VSYSRTNIRLGQKVMRSLLEIIALARALSERGSLGTHFKATHAVSMKSNLAAVYAKNVITSLRLCVERREAEPRLQNVDEAI
jgi:hypothetical protein